MNQLFPELVPFDEQDDATASAHRSLYTRLKAGSAAMIHPRDFPASQIISCAKLENLHSSPTEVLRYYAWLGSACMTTAFIMTQRNAALKRLQASRTPKHRDQWTTRVRSGEWFATVGISHLSTSRQHLSVPPLVATQTDEGWLLNGFTPWVTGATAADVLVIGAMVATTVQNTAEYDGKAGSSSAQVSRSSDATPSHEPVMLAIEARRSGVVIHPGMDLMALSASSTGRVEFQNVLVAMDDWIDPPSCVLPRRADWPTSSPSGAGGLQTSALALGLSAAAIEFLHLQSQFRAELMSPTEGFIAQWKQLFQTLTGAESSGAAVLRKNANDLVLQSTQAALAAAKGAGYVNGHDVGRWCREALFFLVWSCPQTVIDAHLCSFSQYDNQPNI